MKISKIPERSPSYEKKSVLKLLRQQSINHKKVLRVRNRKIKTKKYLQQQLALNHNIFQCSPASQQYFKRSMTAQNLLWQKSYTLKLNINNLIEENSSLKAKLWNISKQNRRMNKQIDCWNLKKLCDGNSKIPFIDAATFQKVLSDQDYSIVSMKMQITEHQRQLYERDCIIQQLKKNIDNIQNFKSHFDREMSERKIRILHYMENQPLSRNNSSQFSIFRKFLKQKINKNNQQKQLNSKNIEILRKLKIQHQNNLLELNQQISKIKLSENLITFQQIDNLYKEIQRIKNSDEDDINEHRQKLKIAHKNALYYECMMQDQMGIKVLKKLELSKMIEEEKIKNKLCNVKKTQKKVEDRIFGEMLIQLIYTEHQGQNVLDFDFTAIHQNQSFI